MVHAHTAPAPGARGWGARRVAASATVVLALLVGLVLAGPTGDALAATVVDLGTAGSFAVLAGSAITNTGPTTIHGDVGLHPSGASSVTGFDDVTLTGETHYADDAALQAKSDLTTAYDAAAGQDANAVLDTELGTLDPLTGGVYRARDGAFEITGALTLDAEGNPDTVWVFQMAETLVTATDSSVVLLNGADACNVFWQVGSSATLGTRTSFAGNILAAESVTLTTSATIRGRALARTGAVTMDTNTINQSSCEARVTPPPPDPSPDPDPSPSPDPTTTPDPTTIPDPTPSPSETVVPADTSTGTPGGTTGAPGGPDDPDAPMAAPPSTGGTPQVPVVPSGGVPAGDGSTAAGTSGRSSAGLLLAALLLATPVLVTWRRRRA